MFVFNKWDTSEAYVPLYSWWACVLILHLMSFTWFTGQIRVRTEVRLTYVYSCIMKCLLWIYYYFIIKNICDYWIHYFFCDWEYFTHTFSAESLIWSKFQYFSRYNKDLKKNQPMLKMLRTFILHNNNAKKLLTNC